MKRLHLYVSGLVQGVFFRARTCDQARALGLSGWVRNREDGRVEIMAEGDDATLAQFLTGCHRGPTLARVTAVDVHEEPASGEFPDFAIRQ